MLQKGVTSVKPAMEKLEYFLELGGTKKDITLLVISGIALIVSIFDLVPLPFDASWAAIILCGIPIILEAVIGLATAFDIKADVLVSLALIASVCIGEDFAAGEVAFIMQLGGLLEELTVARARAGIEKLVHLTPQTARVITGGKETAVPAEAVKVGEDSSIQRMIRLVQSADAGKAKIVGLADRWTTWIVVIALTAAALTWIFSGEIIRAVTILVVFCPCALVLATPTAIMAAIGNATKHGFLVREGDALERLAAVKKITFDKTGTLTYGTPRVVLVHSALPSLSDHELYRLCAAAERYSEHPLGKAITHCCQQETGEALEEGENFQMVPGRGVSARVDEKVILAGNAELLAEHHIAIPEEAAKAADTQLSQGCTVTYTAVDGVFAGFLALSDTIREESANMIDRLSALQVQPVLLTGDHQNAAAAIAAQLHIGEVHANCLPEDKLSHIRAYQAVGEKVCMIGDGVNDAPALKAADVGIAMGGVGSDIAVDAADIALVDDEVKELPHLIALSKRMMRTIKLNITFSLTLNFIAIVLAITGTLNPVVGALVHNAGSVLVITNSALLLKWRQTALAEFRVRRREICLIVNSDDRRVGIYSLRGARVAAAPRAARHKAQRILFKKSGLQNCNPLFLIFFYFLRHTEGIRSTSRGMISSLPSSMMALITSLLTPERKPKLHVGPTAPRPGPTLLMAVSEAVKAAVKSISSSVSTSVPSSRIAI